MYRKRAGGWLKHFDFILLDVLCLQAAFMLAYAVRMGPSSPYGDGEYRGIGIVLLLAAVLLIGLLAACKVNLGKILPKAYGTAMAVFGAALVFLGIAVAVDFTRCFRLFHEMFFTNDLWIFDESTDYMIRMLPEGFFSDMVIRIVSVFITSLILLGALIWLVRFLYGLQSTRQSIGR